MKKAILALSVIFMVIVLTQSWLVGVGGAMFSDQMLAWGGLVGRLLALLLAAGAAFVLPSPLISFSIYLLGGLLGIIFGIYTGYHDMILWGGLSLLLGGGSIYAWHLDKRASTIVHEEPVREVSHF